MLKQCNDIFNSAVLASTISAANELEILNELQVNGFIDITIFCHNQKLHQQSVIGIMYALCSFGVSETTENSSIFKKGYLFEDVYSSKGFFLWLVRGYGHILQNLASIAKNENRTGKFIKRDGKYIAIASHDQGARLVEPYFEQILNEFPFNTVADLGCGSAERLINLANKHPNLHGIGIDINPDAVSVAESIVKEHGLSDRIKIYHGDTQKLIADTEFMEVDTLLCFFNGHDFWPWHNCLQTMRNLHTVFPQVKRFLLCDTYRSGIIPSHELPMFTLGFELIHNVMGQYIPSLTEWMALYAESGWNCVKRQDVEVPFSTIFDLRPV